MDLNHPNWSGKPHRSMQEAYGHSRLTEETSDSKHWVWIVIALVVGLIVGGGR